MSNVIQELGLEHLSSHDRLALAEELWTSVAARESTLPLTERQVEDLRARLRHREIHPHPGSPWDEVLSRLRGQ